MTFNFKKKYLWIGGIVLGVALLIFVISRGGKTSLVPAYTVIKQDVKQTVIATGTVTSQSNLNLAFKNGGVLTRINVKVGAKVKAGQVLAMLDEKDAAASIAQANAALLSARANYDKLANGTSNPEIEVTRVALANAKASYANTAAQQAILVNNALTAMLNSGLAAIPAASNSSTGTITVSGTYNGTVQGQDLITISANGSGLGYSSSGLDSANGFITKGSPITIGTHGLYITFSTTGAFNGGDTWTIPVPNTQASNYLTNYNAYQTALGTQAQSLSTAQGAIDTAQAALDQKLASARPEDLAAASAQIASAQAQLQTAHNTYLNNEIIAPIAGTVTSVDVKIGEQVTPQKEALVLLDPNSLHVESNIPESSIAHVEAGLPIDMTLDALGPDKHLSGEVVSIDPASKVVNGVIDFRVISSIPVDPAIKPGMTVNLVIVVADRDNVLAVPNRLIKSSGGKKLVTVIKNNKTSDVEIKLGLNGDNFTEVTSGLSEGDVLATPASVK